MKNLFTALSLVFVLYTYCQEQPIYSTKAGAIKGYDPVAYFIEGKPIKGLSGQSLEWNGATWFFSSEENKNLFKTEPEKYAPQYGGYCAYGVSKGGLYKIEPEAWTIVDGKLYLNYSLKIQKDWEVDIPGFIEKADENWPGLVTDNN